MTDENEHTLGLICDGIADQNLKLLARMQLPEFDPSLELDCTRNNAIYRIYDFFGALKRFQHGKAPTWVTDRMVRTTDELIDAIKRRYLGKEVQDLANRAGQAFRKSKGVWRIANPQTAMSEEAYGKRLDECADEIINAICDLNIGICRFVISAELSKVKPSKRAKPTKNPGTEQTAMMKRQLREFAKFLERKPILPSCSVYVRAHQCWLEHMKDWERAAKAATNRGYANYKNLARAHFGSLD